MVDREKVIKGLEYCTTHYNCRNLRGQSCPYIDNCKPLEDATGNTLTKDALELLKEQNVCENCAIAIEDRQPVVLCKDCEHSKSYSNGKMFGCEFGNGLHEPDWFCADGERR